MMRLPLFVTVLLPVLSCSADAEPMSPLADQVALGHAADDWKIAALKPLDITLGDAGPDGARSVAVTVDRDALLRDLPTLQQHGAISKSITADEVGKRPASYSNILTLLLTSYAVHDLYGARPDLGVTRWKVALTPVLADAAQSRREVLAFTFDRLRYDSTDWDRLAFTDFPQITAGFSYNLRFNLEMSHEVDGSIADD